MGKILAKGTILGAIIAYIWMMLSWMVLPWHCWTMNHFKNEEAVAKVLMENVEEKGIYVLPNFCGAKGEEFKQKTEAMKKGPFAFTSILPKGYAFDSPAPYVIAFIIQLIGAFFITFFVLQTTNLTYWNRVGFVTLIGLTIGILGYLPSWNWWGFSFGYVLLEIADSVITWFLAGLAIAAVTKKSSSVST